ncbi:MAG: DUF58 domain-containing protein [Nitrospira sp.]|nr:DUF58 domain-containing protein [Nitrospira sp.]HBP90080.1 DUF58 domain-containing protein [Nitrospiraceae bacterium]HNP29127.1 DUF58 domain-containing protein [Nitrospirales bacterium]
MWPFRKQPAPSEFRPTRPSGFQGVEVRLADLINMRHQTGVLGVRTRKRVHSLLAGGERSPFKGRGMDFEESRRYQPGDDVRLMDWRVMARTHEPYLKVFREERERPVFMVVDYRRGMRFGTKVAFKSVIAAQAAALLGWASQERGDRVGAVVFSDGNHAELRPKGGRAGVLQLLNLLAQDMDHPSQRIERQKEFTSPLQLALNRVLTTAKPGSLIFVLSDFREWDQQAKQTLIRLGGHQDVVSIFIYDQLEQEPPPAGQYPVTDGTRMGILNTGSAKTIQSYSACFKERFEDVRRLCMTRGIGFISLGTHDDILFQLRGGLQDLGHRRSAHHNTA